jgi:uncharacterized membrane protein (UPF0136 family)
MASFGIIGSGAAGTVRLIAGLSLLCALACACWLLHQARPRGAVAAAGLALACLILTGAGLAAVHALRAVPVALAIGVLTLAAAWASAARRGPRPADGARTRAPLNLLALAGAGIFAAAAVLAVHYAADSATADADGASSLAIWAYPAGGRLQVGVQAPAGHGAVSLRIVVTQAGTAARAWPNVRIAPGQTWEAPPFAPRGRGPVQVVALDAGTAVATVSASPA